MPHDLLTMRELDPIETGAVIEFGKGDTYRVTNVRVDEDGNVQVTIAHASHNEKVAYDDIREKMEEGEVERVNTGHEAWQWRTN